VVRGFENFFCDMIANQAFAEALLDAICEGKMNIGGERWNWSART